MRTAPWAWAEIALGGMPLDAQGAGFGVEVPAGSYELLAQGPNRAQQRDVVIVRAGERTTWSPKPKR